VRIEELRAISHHIATPDRLNLVSIYLQWLAEEAEEEAGEAVVALAMQILTRIPLQKMNIRLASQVSS